MMTWLRVAVVIASLAYLGVAMAEPQPAQANNFNRLMGAKQAKNPPPSEDGIHDPASLGTGMLQEPTTGMAGFEESKHGNYVDWVKSLEKGKLAPRSDKLDPNTLPIVFDMNIVREVKGSMPNVVYPHKQHTELLDCSNCHPDIFIPQKGANQINMASIMLGQKCGVCHGKVAFPVTATTCRLCHSQPKSAASAKATP